MTPDPKETPVEVKAKERLRAKPGDAALIDPLCPYCGTEIDLVDSSIIYRGKSYGPAYVCGRFPDCDAYVGCHPGTTTPLGRLANRELREAKVAAHYAFDRLWKRKMLRDHINQGSARRAGYLWLAEQIGIPSKDCHIGWFDVAACRRVVEVCRPYLFKAALTPKKKEVG